MNVPVIRTLPEKKLFGKSMRMSLSTDKTRMLWQSFRKEIQVPHETDLYSLQVFEPGHFEQFDPEREFVKWALMGAESFTSVPAAFEAFTIPTGLYAVFHFRGSSDRGSEIFGYIFGTWLPQSEYIFDYRPQFEILGEKYKNNDPDSEEEIWIPIRKKDIL
jgi:AraC family transcriptional regulator